MQTVFHPVDLQKTQWERKRNREESLVPLISIESQQRSIRFPIEISGWERYRSGYPYVLCFFFRSRYSVWSFPILFSTGAALFGGFVWVIAGIPPRITPEWWMDPPTLFASGLLCFRPLSLSMYYRESILNRVGVVDLFIYVRMYM